VLRVRLGVSVSLGFIFCVYFISAKPVAAGILGAKYTAFYFYAQNYIT